jgi:hypothetical protein
MHLHTSEICTCTLLKYALAHLSNMHLRTSPICTCTLIKYALWSDYFPLWSNVSVLVAKCARGAHLVYIQFACAECKMQGLYNIRMVEVMLLRKCGSCG